MQLKDNKQTALILLRIVAASLIAVHGWHRLINGDVDGLSERIGSYFPFGLFLGWAVTLFEAIGAPIFAFGRFVFPLSLVYVLIYTMSICIYHYPHGWFTSGTDADGCEYPVLLVTAFCCIAYAHLPEKWLRAYREL